VLEVQTLRLDVSQSSESISEWGSAPMSVSTCEHCRIAREFRSSAPAYCAEHPDPATVGVTFSHSVSVRINAAELDAVDVAIREVLRVLEHGAHDRHYSAAFARDGYDLQINRAEDHLRARGKLDEGSGLDQLKHALTRLVLAVALLEQPLERDAMESVEP
jgi:hypothetical protein